MKMCIKCGKRKAEVPDRNSFSPRKKVCKKCHQGLLVGDLEHILYEYEHPFSSEGLGQD
jgi:hypothetical protein